jgi:BMFP domain-containing protein YqiC
MGRAAEVADLRERLAELERRVERLEAKPVRKSAPAKAEK